MLEQHRRFLKFHSGEQPSLCTHSPRYTSTSPNETFITRRVDSPTLRLMAMRCVSNTGRGRSNTQQWQRPGCFASFFFSCFHFFSSASFVLSPSVDFFPSPLPFIMLFEDTFEVSAVNPDGKKFDKGECT